jgi:hypothetical protein
MLCPLIGLWKIPLLARWRLAGPTALARQRSRLRHLQPPPIGIRPEHVFGSPHDLFVRVVAPQKLTPAPLLAVVIPAQLPIPARIGVLLRGTCSDENYGHVILWRPAMGKILYRPEEGIEDGIKRFVAAEVNQFENSLCSELLSIGRSGLSDSIGHENDQFARLQDERLGQGKLSGFADAERLGQAVEYSFDLSLTIQNESGTVSHADIAQ